MSTSGLLITLKQDQATGLAMARLRRFPGLTIGHPHGTRLPAVLEAEDAPSAEAAWDSLRDQPGIEQLDVVFVSVEPPGAYAGWEQP